MAKSFSNANTLATIKVLLFLILYGYIFHISFKLVNLIALSIHKQSANTKAEFIAGNMQEIWDFTHAEIGKSQQVQVKTTNKKQKLSPKYKISDKVWFSTRNIHTEQKSKKQDYKMIGPYRIKN